MEKHWISFYITIVVFLLTDFSIHNPSRVFACKNEHRPEPQRNEDSCHVPSSSSLGNKVISCDNREGSFMATKCTVSMTNDEVFKMEAACDGGIFVMTNITIDTEKVRRCHDYQYDNTKCAYSDDDLMNYYEFRNSRLSEDSPTEEKIVPFIRTGALLTVSLSTVCREFCQKRRSNKFAHPKKCHSFIKKRNKYAAKTCMMCRRNGCQFGR